MTNAAIPCPNVCACSPSFSPHISQGVSCSSFQILQHEYIKNPTKESVYITVKPIPAELHPHRGQVKQSESSYFSSVLQESYGSFGGS